MSTPSGGLDLERRPDAVGLHVHVTPRARRPGIGGLHAGALRVAVAAAPIEGRANAALIESLARALHVPPSAVSIERGARGRRKRVWVRGDPDAIEPLLRALALAGA